MGRCGPLGAMALGVAPAATAAAEVAAPGARPAPRTGDPEACVAPRRSAGTATTASGIRSESWASMAKDISQIDAPAPASAHSRVALLVG